MLAGEGGGPGRLKSRGKSKDSGSGSRASGREMLKDEGPRSVEAARSLGLAEPRCRLAVGSRPEPRPQGPQAALRGGGEGSRSERRRSRVCVFIIIISD